MKRYKAFEIESSLRYDGYQRGLASVVYKFFDVKLKMQSFLMPNQLLANELHKPVIKNFF